MNVVCQQIYSIAWKLRRSPSVLSQIKHRYTHNQSIVMIQNEHKFFCLDDYKVQLFTLHYTKLFTETVMYKVTISHVISN
jgi:hypothetical protein